MRLPLLILCLAVGLASCGGPDPTPPPNQSASAGAINASVGEAENSAVDARMQASGLPNTPAAREEVAKNVLGEANSAAGAAAPRP